MATNQLAKQIDQFRLERELTVREAAGMLGISVATMMRILRGEKCHKLTRAKIERRLGKQQAAA